MEVDTLSQGVSMLDDFSVLRSSLAYNVSLNRPRPSLVRMI
jgi:hypothetical protein